MDHQASQNGGPYRVHLVLERRDDAEVTTAPSDPPEQLRVLLLAGC